ncbi:unnamed protein product [Enterobius vermicularis]|uniref:MFS domain-containing protein n=1 Tax=Enterobius vermicularis TaxID=51028 RepID=A0A0N4USP0_ENTVE|nr:unnamed protein product [Enterobius vermicularis]
MESKSGREVPEKGKLESTEVLDSQNNDSLNVDIVVPLPPDGGYGWIIVFAAFSCSFVVDGIATAFGPFIDEFTEKFNASVATISIIGSSLIGSYLIVGERPLAGGLVNRFGVRSIAIFGSLLAGLGFFFSIFATNVTTMILSYGLIAGAGLGFIYLPAMVIVCFYFEKKRSVAVGLAVAGSGVGTIVVPPLNTYLIKEIGCQWTLAILAVLGFFCVFFSWLFKPLTAEQPKKLPIDNTFSAINSKECYNNGQTSTLTPKDRCQELMDENKNDFNPGYFLIMLLCLKKEIKTFS